MLFKDFEWDDGNITHLELRHGVQPYEAEEVFANNPLFRKIGENKHAAFGPTLDGRYLVLVFQKKAKGIIRIITGWDMSDKEKRHYKTHRKG